MKHSATALLFLALLSHSGPAQTFPADDPVIRQIWSEAMDSTRLPELAHQLLDVIGPRLTGTEQSLRAHEWAVRTYSSWGVRAASEQYGTWRGWERGTTHIDLLEPRVRTLEGTLLAWSPGTRKSGLTAEVVILGDAQDSLAFVGWLAAAKGKFVLASAPQLTGRPDGSWEEFARKSSFDSLKSRRERVRLNWERRVKSSGVSADSLPLVLERAGALGVLTSNWSSGWGTYRVFGTWTKSIPVCALSLEDYMLLYRLAEHGDRPRVRIAAEARALEPMPVFNTIARLPGAERPDEYVVLSAHFDSWDAASGATDNGTGTLVMMEAMRVLAKCYPKPRRTIMVGHWGSEEQGLNGSRAFVKDHPEVVSNLQALFNQDNGTGRITRMGASGFLSAGEHLARWLSRIPTEVTSGITISLPGMPAGGGTDHSSFVAAGAPAFGVGSNNWDYFAYTWHTNRDTYDKLVFDELQNNVVLVACLAYLASEDPQTIARVRRVMPADAKTGNPQEWPAAEEPNRTGERKNK